LPILPCDFSLTAIHISGFCQFSDIHISQGSVATYLFGVFKQRFVANLPLSLSAKSFENRLTFEEEIMGKSFMSCFLTHGLDVKL